MRTTGVDELFALAVVLNTTVATLLDPYLSGDQGPGVDLGVPWPDDMLSDFARTFILCEAEPWRRERWPGRPHAEYREQFARIAAARKEREELEKKNSNSGNIVK